MPRERGFASDLSEALRATEEAAFPENLGIWVIRHGILGVFPGIWVIGKYSGILG